ncbi:MAG: ribulose-phosphate 3-epimerase [Coriobacteriaceae bacterium]|nr:ribulose-phosphate 3-epimerase [Coriobacteriaceae bacterium]
MYGPVQIAPSILSADCANLERDVREVVDAGIDWIHVDVMDGHFVPNLTIGPAHVRALKEITDVPLDVHLMIDNPEEQVPWYISAGADMISVHYEACSDPRALIATIHERGAQAGIAINPDTPTEVLADVVDVLDMVLVMSVHPGFAGQSFIPESPARLAAAIGQCKDAGVEPLIEVDGGINFLTAPLCSAVGADVLVAGNAIFSQTDRAAVIKELRHVCD